MTKDYNNELLNDCAWFAEKHRGKNKQSGPYWSTIIRFTPLFDEAARLQQMVNTLKAIIFEVNEMLKNKQARVQEAEKRIAELEETILQDTKVNIAHIALLNSDIAELEKEQQWIHQDKTLIVKKDGDSWYAVCPDFKDLQQSESRWFSGDIGKYMDAVYLYLNDEHHPPQESEK